MVEKHNTEIRPKIKKNMHSHTYIDQLTVQKLVISHIAALGKIHLLSLLYTSVTVVQSHAVHHRQQSLGGLRSTAARIVKRQQLAPSVSRVTSHSDRLASGPRPILLV